MSLTNQNNIVHVAQGKPLTTSLVIAENCNVQHKNAIKLIRKYQSKFEQLGRVDFQTRPFKTKGGIQKQEIALLNEDQATFLITMFRNTDIVLEFKLTLVKEFRRVVTELQRIQSEPNRAKTVEHKRDTAKSMTDALKFIRDMAGKKTEPRHYTNEHLFCNRALTGKWGKLDESMLDAYDVKLLAAIRGHNANLIHHYPNQNDRKTMLDKFVTEYRAKYPYLKLIDGGALNGGLANA
jgi:phage regulator Rha-like protein